ncbi:MAG TPA: sugar ABC transporter permease [Candidatus Saccharimonadales bacterium]|nr:sugar ABC transporter permease [Candidatus Saccharimonadales bacterium]
MTTRSAVAAYREGEPPARRRRRRANVTPYLFVGPAFLALMVFGVLPIVVAAVVSLTNLDISGLANRANIHFVGLDNYARLFADGAFWVALGNTITFVAIGVPSIIVVSLAAAIGLNQSDSRFFHALRTFYFLPAITAIVAISLIWGYLYNSQFGLLNYLLSLGGLPPVGWLTDPFIAKLSVAFVGIWRATGLDIVIFLAALQSIPRDYYEAAAIDGAGDIRRIFSITIPLLRFAIFFVTITTLINWMQFFDEPYVLTAGGPIHATTSISLYIFQEGFQFNQFGFASAASLVLFVIIVSVTAAQLRLRRSSDV